MTKCDKMRHIPRENSPETRTATENQETGMRLPNADTVEALRQARDGEGLTEYASLEDLEARGTAEQAHPANARPDEGEDTPG